MTFCTLSDSDTKTDTEPDNSEGTCALMLHIKANIKINIAWT